MGTKSASLQVLLKSKMMMILMMMMMMILTIMMMILMFVGGLCWLMRLSTNTCTRILSLYSVFADIPDNKYLVFVKH